MFVALVLVLGACAQVPMLQADRTHQTGSKVQTAPLPEGFVGKAGPPLVFHLERVEPSSASDVPEAQSGSRQFSSPQSEAQEQSRSLQPQEQAQTQPGVQAQPSADRPRAIPKSPLDVRGMAMGAHVGGLVFSNRQQALFATVSNGEWWQGPVDTAVQAARTRGIFRVARINPSLKSEDAGIPLPQLGEGIALDDEADRLYVWHAQAGAVSVVDTRTNQLLQTVTLDDGPAAAGKALKLPPDSLKQGHQVRAIQLDVRRHRLYIPVADDKDSALWVVDTRTLHLEKRIPGFGYNASGIALDDAGGRLFVSNLQGQLMEVALDSLSVARVHEIEADQLVNLVYDADQRRLLGVDQGLDRSAWRNEALGREYALRSNGHQLVVIDPDAGRVVQREDVPKNPLGLMLDAPARRLYVTSFNDLGSARGQGVMTAFNALNYRPSYRIPVTPYPAGMALDAKTHALFVSVKNDAYNESARSPEIIARLGL